MMSTIANPEEYEAWNGEGGRRWVANADERDRVLEPVADVLLAAAALEFGERVVDVGCGCGAVTLSAAERVVPGSVVGIDLSEPMLDVARQRAQDTARPLNVEFVQGDAQTHPFEPAAFDAAISRFGTMFFGDPVAAFANLGRGLRPGARICFATWQPLAVNDWLRVPGAALLEFMTSPVPQSEGPGMFAQSDADVVRDVLGAAGYTAVVLEPVELRLTLGATPDGATRYLADTGSGRAALERIPEGRRSAALAAVRAVLGDHADSSGVHLGANIWIVAARSG
jgi:SAM-dependent methyltransferase